MSEPSGWTVQAHWSVGDERRSYAPVDVATEAYRLAEVDERWDTVRVDGRSEQYMRNHLDLNDVESGRRA